MGPLRTYILVYSMQCWTHVLLLKLRHKTVYIPLDYAYLHIEFVLCRSGQLLCRYSRVCVSRTTAEQSSIQEVCMSTCMLLVGGANFETVFCQSTVPRPHWRMKCMMSVLLFSLSLSPSLPPSAALTSGH